MKISISCIVEGYGDVKAVPKLIYRIAKTEFPSLALHVAQPTRVPRNKIVQAGELEKYIEIAAHQIKGHGATLVLIDADEDCPKELGPELLKRARQVCGDLPISVVLANREFEAWFLAAAESLRGQQRLSMDFSAPPHPEAIQGAKERLSKQMTSGKYSETVDQQKLTQAFDLAAAQASSPSFKRCYREIVRLLRELQDRADNSSLNR